MDRINRRSALAVTGAGLTAALARVRSSVAAEPEHPWEKARRLADELSEALAAGDGAFTGPGGKWNAQIYPAGYSDYPIGFGNIRANEWPRKHVSWPCREVIDAHREARKAFEVTCRAVDTKTPTKAATRRYRKAGKAEEKALVAVCAFVPHGQADAKAKAKYLMTFIRHGELYEPHILALAKAGVRL